MPVQDPPAVRIDQPTMAVLSGTVSTPGEEIRRARRSRGLSQEQLAGAAGVSAKTIGRIERGADYDDPRTLPVIRAALGLDDAATDLSKVPAETLMAEVVRRLSTAERILEHARIRPGTVPQDILDHPGTLRGPRRRRSEDNRADG
jgi:transcriptional regulator with XRE-family HTH domain